MLGCIVIVFALSGVEVAQRPSDECLDPALIGVWYRLTIRHPSHPFPYQMLTAFKVTDTGRILRLGLEASTGNLSDKLDHTGFSLGSILCARDGTLILRYPTPPSMAVDTMEYWVGRDTLTVEGRPVSGHFRRSEVGAPVASPVAAEFYALVDGVERRNVAVDPIIPTAHLRGHRGGNVTLRAYIAVEGVSSAWIRVEIPQYGGPGRYAIGPGQGELVHVYGDMFDVHSTHSREAGFIHIHSCDLKGHRCSGTFEFLTERLDGDPEWERRITNGRFAVPVYPSDEPPGQD